MQTFENLFKERRAQEETSIPILNESWLLYLQKAPKCKDVFFNLQSSYLCHFNVYQCTVLCINTASTQMIVCTSQSHSVSHYICRLNVF